MTRPLTPLTTLALLPLTLEFTDALTVAMRLQLLEAIFCHLKITSSTTLVEVQFLGSLLYILSSNSLPVWALSKPMIFQGLHFL